MMVEPPDSPASARATATSAEPTFAKRLGAFDATMIVMGGILGAWVIGGVIAHIGAFVYAELAVLRPRVGGQYAYLRDAYHPIVAFLYGWTLLLVIQTGGMAGAAIIFGRYFRELTGSGVSEQAVAAITLGALTLVNCFGVRAGSNVQSALMLTKLAAIALLIGVGVAVVPAAAPVAAAIATPTSSGGAIGL